MRKILAIFLMLIGIGVVLTPKVIGFKERQEMELEKEEFVKSGSGIERIHEYEDYQSQINTNSKFISSPENEDNSYIFNDEILGYVRIPKIDIDYAIRYGTTEEVLSRNIGLLENSHLPLGGKGNNTVLVGHRGYAGIHAFFRNANELEYGDEVIITNPTGALLYYKVVSSHVVEPDDISLIKLEEDKDKVTLITCHPYMINNQRLIVICERSR